MRNFMLHAYQGSDQIDIYHAAGAGNIRLREFLGRYSRAGIVKRGIKLPDTAEQSGNFRLIADIGNAVMKSGQRFFHRGAAAVFPVSRNAIHFPAAGTKQFGGSFADTVRGAGNQNFSRFRQNGHQFPPYDLYTRRRFP